MAIDNSITFGGINSADFGIYISGEGVFDAPKRDVEMVSIPGRNGEFALDKGRFENIEVTYPAFNYEEDLATFAEKLSDFRNALASQVGYQRLTDTLHPDEYRMATFVDGLEIKPIKYNTASEFDIVFDCKPQRYLTSGETAISVDSGDTVTNPTRFGSSPLLEVEGYGDIEFNRYGISIKNAVFGDVLLRNSSENTLPYSAPTYVNYPITLSDIGALETGDKIGEGNTLSIRATFYPPFVPSGHLERVTSTPPWTEGVVTVAGRECPTATFNIELLKGTTRTISGGIRWSTGSQEMTTWLTLAYDGDGLITFTAERAEDMEGYDPQSVILSVNTIYGESTKSILGAPTYIDCDLGEAYKVEGGEIISLNRYIDLGSDLPELAVGNNTFAFDDTITDLKVVPRWWKI